MIKGCTKRVVVVKDVQSDIFEEAYLIMRPKQEKTKYKSGTYAIACANTTKTHITARKTVITRLIFF